MGKVIRLTESELVRLIKRVVSEQNDNEPYKVNYPDVNKVLGHLKGKTVTLRTKDNKSYINVQIEGMTVKTDNTSVKPAQVWLDVNLIDDYGKSKGGFFGTGVGNNLDVLYVCGLRSFQVDTELVGSVNRSVGGKVYGNENLANEIESKFCIAGTKNLVPKVKTDF